LINSNEIRSDANVRSDKSFEKNDTNINATVSNQNLYFSMVRELANFTPNIITPAVAHQIVLVDVN